MKYAFWASVFALASIAFALDGEVGIHDPSTIVLCDGKHYPFGTGGSALVSDDGWTWSRSAAPGRRGMAPDIIRIGDRYYMCVSANIGAQPKAAVNLISNRTLDPDSPYFKITVAGTDRALAATEDAELVTVPAFKGAPEQLWHIEQLTDGTYRIMPGAIPNSEETLALSAVGGSFATLSGFDSKSDRHRWLLNVP
jgi:hypothetical protein